MRASSGAESLFSNKMTMMTGARRAAFPRMIERFLRERAASVLPPRDLERLGGYLRGLINASELPPRAGGRPDWLAIAAGCGLDADPLIAVGPALEPGIDAIARFVAPRARKRRPAALSAELLNRVDATVDERQASNTPRKRGRPKKGARVLPAENDLQAIHPPASLPRRKRGTQPRPIIEFPEPLWTEWEEPETFSEAFKLHMDRHGDSAWQLRRAVVRSTEGFDHKTFVTWIQRTRAPRSVSSFEILSRIERRYRLPEGYFKAKLAHPARAASGHRPTDITPSQLRRIAWHLPDDFDRRPNLEREVILQWVQVNIISGGTDYRRFQALALRNRYGLRFPGVLDGGSAPVDALTRDRQGLELDPDDDDFEGATNVAVDAPCRLWTEMAELLQFKTATLTTFGFQRIGVWGEETAAQKVEHFGLLFGALAAPKRSAVRGLGIPLEALTFAMLVFPSVWDWYLTWREKRRGFYTAWEVDMLRIALALTRAEMGGG